MKSQTIERSICVPFNVLNKNVKNHLYEKIVSDLLGKCEKEYGYISSIDKNFKILDNTISTAGSGVFFKVELNISSLVPELGTTYEGTVCMVLPVGLFVEVEQKMKILIPVQNMQKYSLDKVQNVFKNGNKIIKPGDAVKVLLILKKYEKQNFSCVGKLVL